MSVPYRFTIAGVLALCCACGNGGGGGGGGVIPPDLCMTLAPATAPAPATVVIQTGAASTCAIAVVELVVTDVSDVFALATTIEYDPVSLAFAGMNTLGSVLARDGAQLNAEVRETVLGKVTIGVSRNAPTGIDVSGSGKLATLFFVPLVEGMDDLTVATPCLTGSETPPVVKAGVACSGGTTLVAVEP